jgi:hypothetical protein
MSPAKSASRQQSAGSPQSVHQDSLAQGPDVGERVRSVKYCFARPCFSRGSRSVPMYSSRKSRSPSTFGVSRDEPENNAHNVIGSGFHSGRIGTSLLRLSGCFAIHSGRTVMPRPSRAKYLLAVSDGLRRIVDTILRMGNGMSAYRQLSAQLLYFRRGLQRACSVS